MKKNNMNTVSDMHILHFFKSFLFIFGLVTSLSIGTFSIWAGSSDEEITSKIKKTVISQPKKAQPASHPTHLARVLDGSPIVGYTQKLEVQGKKLNLKRPSTTVNINYVWTASRNDGWKTHLLARGFCMSADTIWPKPFTITQSFLGALETSSKKMVWVSRGSNATSNNNYFIRTPQTDYQGGHAEPQFISDVKDAFTQNSDAVLKYFMPPADNTDDIYMCGLELFGPYDMCDRFQGSGNNRYDCVGELRDFRKKHQVGNQSISKAIRDKLGDRFKGEKEDAFVLIYHAKYPYENVDTYKAEDEDDYYPLDFDFKGIKFVPRNHRDFFNTSSLSQHENLPTEKNIIYGYIHHLADKKVKYTPNTGFNLP